MQGGLELILDKKEFDANFTFGNPKPVNIPCSSLFCFALIVTSLILL